MHENQLTYNNDLSPIGNNNNELQNPFETDFLTQKSATWNCDRYSSFVEWPKGTDHAVAYGTRFCTLTYFFKWNYLQQLSYREIYWNVFSDIYLNCLIHFFEWKFSFANFNLEKLRKKKLLLSLKNKVFF